MDKFARFIFWFWGFMVGASIVLMLSPVKIKIWKINDWEAAFVALSCLVVSLLLIFG